MILNPRIAPYMLLLALLACASIGCGGRSVGSIAVEMPAEPPALDTARSDLLGIVSEVAAEQGFYEYEVDAREVAYARSDTFEGFNEVYLVVERFDSGPALVKMHVTDWHIGPIAVETFEMLKSQLAERFRIKVGE